MKDLNENILPKGVKISTFYDRTELMGYATHTVIHNLIEGIILVTIIVLIFMAALAHDAYRRIDCAAGSAFSPLCA